MAPDASCQTAPERLLLTVVRAAAKEGVGDGWMPQVIEAAWQARGHGAWGPAYCEEDIRQRTAERERLRHGQNAAH